RIPISEAEFSSRFSGKPTTNSAPSRCSSSAMRSATSTCVPYSENRRDGAPGSAHSLADRRGRRGPPPLPPTDGSEVEVRTSREGREIRIRDEVFLSTSSCGNRGGLHQERRRVSICEDT